MKPPPDWDHHRSFLAVLRTGSLSAAARALGLTQPTVGRHIAALEAGLGGVRLFSRSAQGLVPTAAAQRVRPHAEAMEAAAAAFARAAEGAEAALTGTVRVSASDLVGTEVLPPILRGLRAAHPGLAVELELSNAPSDLLRREADIAVRMVRPTQKALVARPAGRIAVGLHAHPDYLARRGTPQTAEALAGHDLVGFDRDPFAARALAALGLPLDRRDFAFRIDDQPAQLAAIRAGCGIGFAQVPAARRPPGLVRVLPGIEVALDCWIVMHEDLRGDARMRAAFDHLHREMRAYAAGH